jgi:hypothetical protein
MISAGGTVNFPIFAPGHTNAMTAGHNHRNGPLTPPGV